VEGGNTKAKLSTRKAYGFKTYQAAEIALYHVLGALPVPELPTNVSEVGLLKPMLIDYFSILIKWKKFIFGLCVLASLLTLGVNSFNHKIYESKASFVFSSDLIRWDSDKNLRKFFDLEDKESKKSETSVDRYDIVLGQLKSSWLADLVVRDLKLNENLHVSNFEGIRSALPSDLRIQIDKKDKVIFSIIVKGRDPEIASIMANSYLVNLEKRYQENVNFLTKSLFLQEKLKKDIDIARVDYKIAKIAVMESLKKGISYWELELKKVREKNVSRKWEVSNITKMLGELRLRYAFLDESKEIKPEPLIEFSQKMEKPFTSEIIFPKPGSSLQGSAATFKWTGRNDNVRYHLLVGTRPGEENLHSWNYGKELSATVYGLPTDGRSLYARIWYWIDGENWQYNDSQFIAVNDQGMPKITNPTTGSTLLEGATTLIWSTVNNLVGFHLQVGSFPGGGDLHDKNYGEAISAILENLPTDGRPLFVRLWRWVEGRNWEFTDFQFKAFGDNYLPKVTDPSPGSVLSGTSALFKWTGVEKLISFHLQIGSQPGGSDLHNMSYGKRHSATVNDLPIDGRPLYVRLWRWVEGHNWEFSDFNYYSVHIPIPVAQHNKMWSNFRNKENTLRRLITNYAQYEWEIQHIDQSPFFHVTEKATPAGKESNPSLFSGIITASILSIIIGVALSFFLEYFHRRMPTVDQHKIPMKR